jgi:hypothetical protein
MSWSRRQQATFAAQGAALRRQTQGVPATYAGKPLCLTHSAVRSHRDIAAAGFETMPDFVARVDMAAYPWFTPQSGQPIVIDGQAYKLAEIAKIQLAGEWWFSLKKA